MRKLKKLKKAIARRHKKETDEVHSLDPHPPNETRDDEGDG